MSNIAGVPKQQEITETEYPIASRDSPLASAASISSCFIIKSFPLAFSALIFMRNTKITTGDLKDGRGIAAP